MKARSVGLFFALALIAGLMVLMKPAPANAAIGISIGGNFGSGYSGSGVSVVIGGGSAYDGWYGFNRGSPWGYDPYYWYNNYYYGYSGYPYGYGYSPRDRYIQRDRDKANDDYFRRMRERDDRNRSQGITRFDWDRAYGNGRYWRR